VDVLTLVLVQPQSVVSVTTVVTVAVLKYSAGSEFTLLSTTPNVVRRTCGRGSSHDGARDRDKLTSGIIRTPNWCDTMTRPRNQT
jgi:hypothetical protein